MQECQRCYPEWQEVFIPIEADLLDERIQLPHCDLLIANLLMEYIGYTRFQTLAKQSSAVWIRVVIQQDFAEGFVSDFPDLPSFVALNTIHEQLQEVKLTRSMLSCLLYTSRCV